MPPPQPRLPTQPAPALHLYLHIPFCARRCSYCDFAIAVRREVPHNEFVRAVEAEWGRSRCEWPWSQPGPVATVYLGGGTPSRLAPWAVHRLLDRIRTDRGIADGAEVTLEANPDDVTPEVAAAWAAAGVTRVSLGVQSFDDRVLTWMHRTHSAGQVAPAVGAVRAAGIGQLSLDLIYGLPTALERDWARDLDLALGLAPDHLSCYGLTIEPRTPLARWVARGDTVPASDRRHTTEFRALHRRATEAGFEHYEVSNLARPGARAHHNSAYWRRASFLGLGPGAHSGHGRLRRWNIAAWPEWQQAALSGGATEAGREELDEAAVALEELYLGLRTSAGVEATRVPAEVRARWEQAGWATEPAGRVALTPAGWLRLDALVVEAANADSGGPFAPGGAIPRFPG